MFGGRELNTWVNTYDLACRRAARTGRPYAVCVSDGLFSTIEADEAVVRDQEIVCAVVSGWSSDGV